MTIIIIAIFILVILGLIVAGVASGLFRIEKVEVSEEADIAIPEETGEEETYEDTPEMGGEFPTDPADIIKQQQQELDKYLEAVDSDLLEGNETPDKEGKTEEELEEEENRFNTTDRLSDFRTGRGYLMDCQKQLDQARKEGAVYAAVYFDIARFRFINNLKGYTIGDTVLTRMSQELPQAFPEGALITRISADHFAAIFPVSDIAMFDGIDEQIKMICEKIRNHIGLKSPIRTCIGVALTEQSDRDYNISILLTKANIARHCIKTSRNETYRIFEETMLSSFFFGESALDDYSENQYDEEFVLYYTPQEDISLHQIVGCEVLARWNCEEEVDKALPLSVHKNKIPTNCSKVIYHACKAMSRWRKSGKQILPVSVNVPATTLFKQDFDEFLAKVLSEFQLEPHMLTLVIEAAIVRLDWTTTNRQLKRLQDMGVSVGVDEIDTGYANLEFLAGLPLTFAKLHRSFAKEIDKDELKQDRARDMLKTAKDYNLQLIFEGVDSIEQANCLRELGARMVQGTYSGRPQKPDVFAQGLPEYVERLSSPVNNTVILEDTALTKGEYNVY